jgi:hypothetical protein
VGAEPLRLDVTDPAGVAAAARPGALAVLTADAAAS